MSRNILRGLIAFIVGALGLGIAADTASAGDCPATTNGSAVCLDATTGFGPVINLYNSNGVYETSVSLYGKTTLLIACADTTVLGFSYKDSSGAGWYKPPANAARAGYSGSSGYSTCGGIVKGYAWINDPATFYAIHTQTHSGMARFYVRT